jgi:hypothetical protein
MGSGLSLFYIQKLDEFFNVITPIADMDRDMAQRNAAANDNWLPPLGA